MILVRGLSEARFSLRVITTWDDSEARFVNHEFNYRPTSDHTKSTYQLIIKITIFEKHKK